MTETRTNVPLGRLALAGLSLAALLVACPAAAQLPPVPEAVDRLDFLVGDWEGGGWMEYTPGQRAEFRGTERVERRMGGRLVVVEGAFTAPAGPNGGEVAVHQALGVFSYDRERDGFQFRTWTARGGRGEAHEAEVGDRRIVWGYDDPVLGAVRYTIVLTPEGEWHEVGDVAGADGSWRRFFEMRLAPK